MSRSHELEGSRIILFMTRELHAGAFCVRFIIVRVAIGGHEQLFPGSMAEACDA